MSTATSTPKSVRARTARTRAMEVMAGRPPPPTPPPNPGEGSLLQRGPASATDVSGAPDHRGVLPSPNVGGGVGGGVRSSDADVQVKLLLRDLRHLVAGGQHPEL